MQVQMQKSSKVSGSEYGAFNDMASQLGWSFKPTKADLKTIEDGDLPDKIKALALVELHKVDELQVRDCFNKHHFSASYTVPEQLQTGGNHGGEVVAIKSHVHGTPIQQDILDSIASHFSVPRRFSARIVRFRKL